MQKPTTKPKILTKAESAEIKKQLEAKKLKTVSK